MGGLIPLCKESTLLVNHFDTIAELSSNTPGLNRALVGRAYSPVRVDVIRLADLTTRQRSAWADLETDASDGNPFLSPGFALPAWKYLTPSSNPVLIVISRGRQWLGMGLFESAAATRQLPVPHLRQWQSEHSFLHGLLLRNGSEQIALRRLWHFLQHGEHHWHAVEMPQLAHDQSYVPLLHETARASGVEVLQSEVHSRACLRLDKSTDRDPLAAISTRRQRSLRQSWNWLNRQGEASFQIERDQRRLPASCQYFLTLEAQGWKAQEQTALLSTERNRRFFNTMAENFTRQRRLFVSELSCGQTTIGSVVHLQSGPTAYAFKLGWDPQFARGCPGYHLKAQALFQAGQHFGQLQMIDSCACPGSFIEHIWPDRRQFSGSLFLTSQAGIVAGGVVDTLRKLRNCGRRLLTLNSEHGDSNE